MAQAMPSAVDWLILIPTELERKRLRFECPDRVRIELCGLGCIAAAARTLELIYLYRPAHVVLAGVAGGYGDLLEIGRCYSFAEVLCDAVGGSDGTDRLSPQQLGFSQLPASLSPSGRAVDDRIELTPFPACQSSPAALTVGFCSGSQQEAEARRSRFPEATAEEMEGFGAALACHMRQTPFAMIRGISNPAGIRDKGRWRIDEALDAVSDALFEVLD